jgi:hypothetical protein
MVTKRRMDGWMRGEKGQLVENLMSKGGEGEDSLLGG